MAEYHWAHMFSTRDLFADEMPSANFDFIPTPAGPDGIRQAHRDEGIGVTGVVPSSSKNGEHVIRYLNSFYSDENLVYLYLGEEGVHWRYDDDGNRVPINPAFDDERGMMFQYAFTEPGKTLYPLWLTRVNKVASMGVAYRDMGEVLEGSFVSDPLANAFYLPIHDRYNQSLDQMVNDELMVMILGDQPMEEWDEFVRRWREAGGEESTQEVNEWYQGR
jgi:putative aldouronate transport system substrate-binding protein